DGNVWQIRSDGIIVEPSDDTEVCYGNSIPFDPQITFQLNKTLSNDEFFKAISDAFPDQNAIYAFRVDGDFDVMNVRSVPAQEEPYPPLSEVVKHQSVFPLQHVSGTMSGFWFPEWMQGVNYPGFHSHFITDTRDAGGHVLNATTGNVSVSIQPVHQVTIILPDEKSY
ncbi:MAG: acetolactate decarboxylase, partial [Methanospirillum sp.]|uniref:acetolactate decarboxylase n=1 Tax=Methanospirillum sp. TaxID=45200 RepID=UPI002370A7AA